MARPLRIEFSGAVYHLTSRGNARQAIFKDDHDRLRFLDSLKKVVDRYHWLCHAYCLMGNHYHLVIETPDGNLARGMRQLNGVYTQDFDRRHHKTGHIFQGRYKAIVIQKGSHLLEICRYVVLNPVRAKVTKDPARWKWSSYGATAGTANLHECLSADWVLSQFGERRGRAQKQYRDFVKDGIGGERIYSRVKGQSVLGEEDFVDKLMGYVRGHEKLSEVPKAQRSFHQPSLERLFKEREKRDKSNRDKKIEEAVDRHGYSEREVADSLGMHYSTISKILTMPKAKT